jgi:hypothetical protein
MGVLGLGGQIALLLLKIPEAKAAYRVMLLPLLL